MPHDNPLPPKGPLGVKVILEILIYTPVTFTNLYMDDGGLTCTKTYLNTNKF
jgi:hypothetical protein